MKASRREDVEWGLGTGKLSLTGVGPVAPGRPDLRAHKNWI